MQKTPKELMEDILSPSSSSNGSLVDKINLNNVLYVGTGSALGAFLGYEIGDDVARSIGGAIHYGISGLFLGGILGGAVGYINNKGLRYVIPSALASAGIGTVLGSLSGISSMIERDTTGGIFSILGGAAIGGAVGYGIKKYMNK